MNKGLFFTGASILGLEAILVLSYLFLSFPGLIGKLFLVGGFISLNIIALVMMIVGALK